MEIKPLFREHPLITPAELMALKPEERLFRYVGKWDFRDLVGKDGNAYTKAYVDIRMYNGEEYKLATSAKVLVQSLKRYNESLVNGTGVGGPNVWFTVQTVVSKKSGYEYYDLGYVDLGKQPVQGRRY